ncbi:MAG: (d)CMP kinase [Candidatus Delongbacteria bacterium]
MPERYQIAIDGPAASGKSTTARRVAGELGIQYLDTGAMYRALTLDVLRRGRSPKDEAGVLACLAQLELDWRAGTVWLAGQDVGEAIRDNQVSVSMGPVCALPEVRAWMVDLQRRLGSRESTVLDGRDIGTVVFPAARFKFFLVADLTERARRRQRELAGRGLTVPLEELTAELERRDASDAARSTGPLRRAPDAELLDTTLLSLEEQTGRILERVRRELGRS